VAVVTRTTAQTAPEITTLFSGEDVLRFHEIVRKVPVAEEIVRYAVKLAAGSRPRQTNTPDFINEWISWGAGTRAAQYLVLGAKARALLRNRAHVTLEDVQTLANPTLRHRILLNYRAEAEGVTVETVVKRLIDSVKPPFSK
jgi:MoxR-like ATPase